ncbi:MAG TPA: FAD-binding protein, partial [Arcobacter sp.]|nr:FAD-binding protein [Arcobacter sp.]
MKNITIIGGGLGGLTAGALLSKEGYKITLLEQH